MASVKSIPIPRKFGYSIGHTLNDLTGAVWFSYLIAYFYNVRNFDSMLAGYLMLVGQIADAIFTPLVGLGSDRYKGFCIGKRQSWHIIGVCFIVVSFPFIFTEVIDFTHWSQWSEFLFYAVAVVLFTYGWASVQVSHLSMIPELTHQQDERVLLNSLRYSVTVVSTLFVYLLAWLLFYLQRGKNEYSKLNKEDGDVFRNLAIIVVGVGLTASILFYVLVREKTPSESHSGPQNPYSKSWIDWLKYPTFYKTIFVCMLQIAVIYMCTRLVVNISQIYIPMYITESLQMPKDSLAIVPLVVYVSQFLMALLMKIENKTLGRKGAYCLGQLFTLGACLWIYFINKDNINQVYGAAIFIGIGGSTVLVTSLAMTSDLIGENLDSDAFVYGCVSFTDKLGNGIAIVLIQRLNPCSHSGSAANCTDYFRNVLIGVPGGVTVVAFIVLLTVIPLGHKHEKGIISGEDNYQREDGTNQETAQSSYRAFSTNI